MQSHQKIVVRNLRDQIVKNSVNPTLKTQNVRKSHQSKIVNWILLQKDVLSIVQIKQVLKNVNHHNQINVKLSLKIQDAVNSVQSSLKTHNVSLTLKNVKSTHMLEDVLNTVKLDQMMKCVRNHHLPIHVKKTPNLRSVQISVSKTLMILNVKTTHVLRTVQQMDVLISVKKIQMMKNVEKYLFQQKRSRSSYWKIMNVITNSSKKEK